MGLSARKAFMKTVAAGAFLFALALSLASCGEGLPTGLPGGDSSDSDPAAAPPIIDAGFSEAVDLDAVGELPSVALEYQPEASGALVETSSDSEIDYSNTSSGYVMARYTGEPTGDQSDIRVIIDAPNDEQSRYNYHLPQDGEYYVFPFTEGDGSYTVSVFKRHQGDMFEMRLSVVLDVALTDGFVPFLQTNQKVSYSPDSLSVKLAGELAGGEDGVIAQVESVYNYVVANVRYDTEKANAAAEGALQTYIPDNDRTLRTGLGICYDYATLTTAMLRSLDIPTKTIFGYVSMGDGSPVYHAWISVYSEETGWINDIIEFTADGWTRMDPTFSAGANDYSTAGFIGDGQNYADDFIY